MDSSGRAVCDRGCGRAGGRRSSGRGTELGCARRCCAALAGAAVEVQAGERQPGGGHGSELAKEAPACTGRVPGRRASHPTGARPDCVGARRLGMCPLRDDVTGSPGRPRPWHRLRLRGGPPRRPRACKRDTALPGAPARYRPSRPTRTGENARRGRSRPTRKGANARWGGSRSIAAPGRLCYVHKARCSNLRPTVEH